MDTQRKSILIGCSEYDEDYLRLECVEYDLQCMNTFLKECGFKNEVCHNMGRNELNLKLLDFTSKCKENELCLIYFSGHGCNSDCGDTYIMPKDYYKKFLKGEMLENYGIRVADIIRIMPECQVIIIIDSCRTKNEGNRALDLAKIDIKKDMFVLYATQNSHKAFGNKNGCSFFTDALLETLKADVIGLEDMAIKIRNLLSDKGQAQLPISMSGMTKKIYLNDVLRYKLCPKVEKVTGTITTILKDDNGCHKIVRIDCFRKSGNGNITVKSQSGQIFSHSSLVAIRILSKFYDAELENYDYEVQVLNGMQGKLFEDNIGLSASLAVASLIEDFEVLSSILFVGEANITTEIERTFELEDIFSIAVHENIEKVLMPLKSALGFGAVSSELIGSVVLGFYSDFSEAVEKLDDMSKR